MAEIFPAKIFSAESSESSLENKINYLNNISWEKRLKAFGSD